MYGDLVEEVHKCLKPATTAGSSRHWWRTAVSDLDHLFETVVKQHDLKTGHFVFHLN